MSEKIKGLYLCRISEWNDHSSGVVKKIQQQVLMMKKEKIDIELLNLDARNRLIEIKRWIFPLNFTNKSINELNITKRIDIRKYDFIYIRMWMLIGAFCKMLREIKTKHKNIKIILEIPTYPFEGELKGLRKMYFFILRHYYKRYIRKYIDKITTYSKDDVIWNVSTIRISNGINLKKIKLKKEKVEDNSIHMIGVANIHFWHGYDRLIEGIYQYYKNGGKRRFVFHIIGNGEAREVKKYKNLVKKYKLDKHIIMHGKCYNEELDCLYDISDIGIDALGRHRSGVYYNSSLKGKEYGAKGLLILSGVETELDKYKNYLYYYRVSANDDFIDMKGVEMFFDSVYFGKNREEIAMEIRKFTKEHFAYPMVFKPVIQYLKSSIIKGK